MRFIFLFTLLFLKVAICAETIYFHKDVKGEESTVTWDITNKNGKIHIIGDSNEDKTIIECSKDYDFEQFVCDYKKNDSKLILTRSNDKLEVVLENGDKKKTESYDVKKYPWVQDFGFGLKPFLASSKDTFLFYIINPKDLSIQTMIATKQNIEDKTFLGKTYQAQKVKITLDGFYKRFWKAELWFDTKTKQLLFYKANEGPSTPTTILTFKG